MKNLLLVLILLLNISIFNCREKNFNPEKSIEYVMPDRNGFWSDGTGFYIKYKYIFWEYKEENMLIPVFGGTLPPVKYSDLEKLQDDPRLSLLGNIRIDVEPGQVKKTVLELVDFYSREFNEENKKPTIIGGEFDEYIVWYDFTLNGVPFSIMLQFPGMEDLELGGDRIEDLEIQESGLIYLSLSISPFSRSPFFKE